MADSESEADAIKDAAEGAARDVTGVVKGLFKTAADLVSKTGVIIVTFALVGIVLLLLRDLLYQITSWSTTELVVTVGLWDAWVLYSDYANAYARQAPLGTVAGLTSRTTGQNHHCRTGDARRHPRRPWHQDGSLFLRQRYHRHARGATHFAMARHIFGMARATRLTRSQGTQASGGAGGRLSGARKRC